MFQHTNEFNSVYFQTAFENKHIIKRCFGLQIYKAETRRSIERRYVRRSIEQPPALHKSAPFLPYSSNVFPLRCKSYYCAEQAAHLLFRYPCPKIDILVNFGTRVSDKAETSRLRGTTAIRGSTEMNILVHL